MDRQHEVVMLLFQLLYFTLVCLALLYFSLLYDTKFKSCAAVSLVWPRRRRRRRRMEMEMANANVKKKKKKKKPANCFLTCSSIGSNVLKNNISPVQNKIKWPVGAALIWVWWAGAASSELSGGQTNKINKTNTRSQISLPSPLSRRVKVTREGGASRLWCAPKACLSDV